MPDPSIVTGQIVSGAVKAYAVSGDARLATLPDVPTATEAGVNYRMSIWAGLFAPRGCGKEIVDRLSDALGRTLDDPDVQRRLAELGATIPPKGERSPAKFDSFVRAEIARWSPILTAASGGRTN